ncbi:MAG: hypothetical protein D6790_11650, partial [Caldilineae bacterium]
NRTDQPRSVTITVDAAALGLSSPERLRVTDVASGASLPRTPAGSTIQFSLDLAPRQTRIVQMTVAPGADVYLPHVQNGALQP